MFSVGVLCVHALNSVGFPLCAAWLFCVSWLYEIFAFDEAGWSGRGGGGVVVMSARWSVANGGWPRDTYTLGCLKRVSLASTPSCRPGVVLVVDERCVVARLNGPRRGKLKRTEYVSEGELPFGNQTGGAKPRAMPSA